jgi:ADP-heptose:LPS heptosyltransferase
MNDPHALSDVYLYDVLLSYNIHQAVPDLSRKNMIRNTQGAVRSGDHMVKDDSGHSSGLLIHPGGLGDVCLSESTLLSLKQHFGTTLEAVGTKPVLDMFRLYFTGVDSIDRRTWVYLFSDSSVCRTWQRIILIGKDRTGTFRERVSRLCDELIFIDMYPEGQPVHVEEYQLEQLPRYGIAPVRKEVQAKTGKRIILYPEKPYKKKKWPVGRFLEVYEKLTSLGIEAVLMRPPDLDLPAVSARAFELLADIAAFFSAGGIFFSNDSGMAHFAARCGLRAATLFQDTNPLIWRPKGGLILECAEAPPSVDEVADFVMHAL